MVLFADEADRERALQGQLRLLGHVAVGGEPRAHRGHHCCCIERVDGIVLVSAFPCGPDSMTDDAIVRCIQGKPVLEPHHRRAEAARPGLETRVESFVDILRYQKKGGYVGA